MITVTEEMAARGGLCPVCGHQFRPNGVGPTDIKELATALNSLPSSHVLKYGANWHDWAYHLGRAFGSREQADDLMLTKNREKIGRLHRSWIEKQWLYAMNYRNYYAVRVFGSKFWNKKGCKDGVN